MHFITVVLTVTLITLVFSPNARSNWGCEVLLCLSNPGGPLEFVECHDPIKKLYRHLRKGRGFPSCELAGTPQSVAGSWAQHINDPYDPCPLGLQPASAGTFVTEGQLAITPNPNVDSPPAYEIHYVPAPSEYDSPPRLSENPKSTGVRACVGNHIGNYTVKYWVGDTELERTITVFDQVHWQQQQSPAAIDVYIDGKFYQRVRY